MKRGTERVLWLTLVLLSNAAWSLVPAYRGRGEAVALRLGSSPPEVTPSPTSPQTPPRIPVQQDGVPSLEAGGVTDAVAVPRSLLKHTSLYLMKFDAEGLNPDVIDALGLTKEQASSVESALLSSLDNLASIEARHTKVISDETGDYLDVEPFSGGDQVLKQLRSVIASTVPDAGRREVLSSLVDSCSLFTNFGRDHFRVFIELKTPPDGREYPIITKQIIDPDGTARAAGANSWEAIYYQRRYGRTMR